MSKPKILINGCGITYQGPKYKTWPNVLKVLGFETIDVSGPAVSNQWILNKTSLALLDDQKINTVVIQLTNLGKLDVEVNRDRIEKMVINDPLRNFLIAPDRTVVGVSRNDIANVPIGSIWPSSASQGHPAKQYWHEFLFSPALELEDIFCKLMMMGVYCQYKKINLVVFQGYHLPWQSDQLEQLGNIIRNPEKSLYQAYQDSAYYQYHDHADQNSVPCFQYQTRIAEEISAALDLDEVSRTKLSRIIETYDTQR